MALTHSCYVTEGFGMVSLPLLWLLYDQCHISPTLAPPEKLTGAPLMVIYKKVTLHFGTEWPSNQNILIADTISA